MRQVRSDEARAKFRTMLNEVEYTGEHVEILRYNKPAVMVVPVKWYERAKAALEREQAQ